jgi:predicted tellurium resistance membrane protein TerC
LWVVVTGGILGIVAMRLVVGQMIAIIERYPALVDGAFVIIAWVGAKLIIEYLHVVGIVAFEIPQWLSLGLIIVIFILAFIWAQQVERKRLTKTEKAARGLYDGDVK